MSAVATPLPASLSRKILLSVAVLAAAASIAGLGTFATFTDSAARTQQVTTGSVDIILEDPTLAVANDLSVAATGVAAGDSIHRVVNLRNAGSLPLASVVLNTTATVSSVLDTDTGDGLQMVVQRCDVAWVEVTATNSFTCADLGGADIVLASGAVIGSRPLAGANALAAGGSDNLLVSLTLPVAAGNDFQNKTSTIAFTFDATQRAATNR